MSDLRIKNEISSLTSLAGKVSCHFWQNGVLKYPNGKEKLFICHYLSLNLEFFDAVQRSASADFSLVRPTWLVCSKFNSSKICKKVSYLNEELNICSSKGANPVANVAKVVSCYCHLCHLWFSDYIDSNADEDEEEDKESDAAVMVMVITILLDNNVLQEANDIVLDLAVGSA